MKLIIQLIIIFWPWSLRRVILNNILGFKIHKSARICFSIILAKDFEMLENSYIGSFSLCNRIDNVSMGSSSYVGSFVYITGYPTTLKEHFNHIRNRKCELKLGAHSAITSRHFIDCTAGVTIGDFTTIAGIRSQIFTHSIDLTNSRQDAKPIHIGNYCFVGTGCVILPGSHLPEYSILGANSLLNRKLDESDCLYGGVPAKKIKILIRSEVKYFNRSIGAIR